MPEGRGGRKLGFIIELAREESFERLKASMFKGAVDRGLGQRGHDLVSRGVGMQAVLGQVALEQTFVVDHGAEVVEIEAVRVRCDIFFQPAFSARIFSGERWAKKSCDRGV
jgi:hypothetical protein